MGLDTPCLNMGLDRLNNLNNPGRQTPARKAGQRLNAVAGIARIASRPKAFKYGDFFKDMAYLLGCKANVLLQVFKYQTLVAHLNALD